MARRKKKQKILASHWYLDLTQELEIPFSNYKAVKESFDQLIQFAENIHPGAISVIESIQDALSSAAEAGTVQYVQASKLSLQQVIKPLRPRLSMVIKGPSGTFIQSTFRMGRYVRPNNTYWRSKKSTDI